MTREEIEEEFKKQIENGDQKALQELKDHPNLCEFYKDKFDDISSLIERCEAKGAKVTIEDMKELGMPSIKETSFFRQFIENINKAIKNGHIKKSDL